MTISENLINKFNRIATGSSELKKKYTILAGSFFLIITALFVIVPVWLGQYLGIHRFIHHTARYIVSFPLMLLGFFLVIWSNVHFRKVKGTPVPFNPPPNLVTTGPFAYTRNPMTTGLFLLMFGLGFHAGSALSVFIFTPLYIIIHILELKYVEEPEIEKRLGQEYLEYKKKVPMVFPYKGKYHQGT
ncbi:MAG: isoprenylcysteine carboxylmethyltransferase family protein [Ignavibacteria bacterium]|jgi:protein-S-isoprenylcysteine O-methyltransferase Ste14